jgi:hypothetical protein
MLVGWPSTNSKQDKLGVLFLHMQQCNCRVKVIVNFMTKLFYTTRMMDPMKVTCILFKG